MTKKRRYAGIAAVMLATVIVNSWAWHLPTLTYKITDGYDGGEYEGTEGVLMQSSYNDCGPAALQMVFDRFGISSSVDEIERTVHPTGNGVTMLDLKQMAEHKGLHAEGWRLTITDLARTTFPALLFVHNDHFIVADSICNDAIFLRDPAEGKIKLPTRNLSRVWRGETLIIAQK